MPNQLSFLDDVPTVEPTPAPPMVVKRNSQYVISCELVSVGRVYYCGDKDGYARFNADISKARRYKRHARASLMATALRSDFHRTHINWKVEAVDNE